MSDKWEVLSSKVALSNAWITLRQDTVRLPGGLVIEDYNVVEQHDFVSIFPLTEQNEVVFVRQYKHGVGRVTLELPAGFIDGGEEPHEAAVRELREETGYAGKLRKVASFTVNPTREQTLEHLYFGRVSRVGSQCLEPSEAIEVVLIPAAEVKATIERGDISVLSTVACCLFCLPLVESL